MVSRQNKQTKPHTNLHYGTLSDKPGKMGKCCDLKGIKYLYPWVTPPVVLNRSLELRGRGLCAYTGCHYDHEASVYADFRWTPKIGKVTCYLILRDDPYSSTERNQAT